MSTNSNLLLFFLFFSQTVLSTGLSTASTTLLITGHSSNNIYKYAFAQKFASQVELDRAHPTDFLVLTSEVVESIEMEDGITHRIVGGLPLSGNLSRIVVSRLGGQEMSLDHIQAIYRFFDSDEPLIVVEIGEQSVQTRALLSKGAVCWGRSTADLVSPNIAYLCNDLCPETVKKIIAFNSIHSLEDESRLIIEEPRPFWPCFFASAAKTEKKNRRKQAQEVIEVEEDDVEEIVDQIMENMEKAVEKHHKIDKPTDKKLNCKYRKSCYESGTVPKIEDRGGSSFEFDDLWEFFNIGEKKEEEDQNDDKRNDDDDLTPKKLKCKYRLDCYKEKGIKLTGKDEEREERKSLLTGKVGVQHGKKRTLKEIAEKTVKNVKVAEEKAAARPLSTSMIAEKKLNEIEEKLNEKLQCKYRKSCYETGELPVIEASWSLPSFSIHSAEEAAEDVDFKEMEELEKKLFCKYRKSCYGTGVKPDIEPEIQIHSLSDLGELPDIIETRKMTIQEKCKYRKSCYETGILPDLSPKIENVIQEKELNVVIPTNVEELKKFCKYRKSCYEEIAHSASVETVKNIRKRRIVEKEVKRRKMRRARMRRRLRNEAIDINRRSKRYTIQPNETKEEVEVKSKKIKKVKEEINVIVEEQIKKNALAEEEGSNKAKKESESTKEPPIEEPPKQKKKTKKMEPEPIPEPVEEPPLESPKKKKKTKKMEPEPIPEPVEEPSLESPKKKKKTKKELEVELTPESPEVMKELPRPLKKKPEPELVKEPKIKVLKTKKEESPEQKEVIDYKEHQKLQEHCKYRKSCYETKERPIIVQTISTLYDKLDNHVTQHYEEIDNRELSESNKKLACKYRKSCYETNKKPVIEQNFASIWGTATADLEEGERPEGGWRNEEYQKLSCKYRKSCYEEHEWDFDGDRKGEKEPAKEVKKVEKKTEQKPKKKIEPKEVPLEKKKVTEEKEEKEDPKEVKEEDLPDLSIHQKLGCKYRKSCYVNTPSPELLMRTVSSDGFQRVKCNQYYLSCREKMGLPPKEKAPIGPNGKRLCRKKKTN